MIIAAAPSPGTNPFRELFKRWGWLLPAAGLAGIVIWQFWSPSPVSRLASGPFPPRFRIAQETTFITDPLDEDGYPDYEEALNQRLAKGVAPDNNRVAALLKATGPRPPGGRPFSDPFYERLRVPPPPERGDTIDVDLRVKRPLRDAATPANHCHRPGEISATNRCVS